MIMQKLFMSIATLFLAIFFSATLLHAKILVISPHPDDDVLIASGVIGRAVAKGEEVRVVYMTNGDYTGTATGYVRQGEAVAGQGLLGVPENQLMFLGYPDGSLITIYTNYPNATDQFISPNGVSATYGNRGLGGGEYHFYRFGSHAGYNRANILTDLQDILSSYQPDHILVTPDFDQHPDHAATYQMLRLALTAVNSQMPNYVPIVHKAIVHWNDGIWPNLIDPTLFFSLLPEQSSGSITWAQTGLAWSDRESLDVPLAMQSTTYSLNPKSRAIAAHVSQGGASGFLSNFIHKDEIFWAENVLGSNRPPIVNAGLDQMAVQGSGSILLNGSLSRDIDGSPLTFQWVQRSGIPVQMFNASSATPSITVPSGLSQNETLTFELTVSDGQFISLSDAVSVIVLTKPNIAPLATVTASSETPQDGQAAVKAIDGYADGYPAGDGTHEWATARQGVGAWVRLTWPIPYAVDRVVLFDRPNLDDNITSATITFSDGSTLATGPLKGNGAESEYAFPSRTITSLIMNITGVSAATYSIGLAEIQVFGTASGQTQYTLTTNASPSGGGTVTVNPSQSSYASGTQITLIAVPNAGYTFSGWSGGATGTTNPLTITITNNTSITANFTAITGALVVTPSSGLTASGTIGGPFTPSAATYTLQNSTNALINWFASSTQSWVSFSTNSGSLASGASTTVSVSFNSNANNLATGSYADTVTFTNLTNGNGNATRAVSLSVTSAQTTANIAPQATVTASSESSQYGQTAGKAVDGFVDGYPNNETREWATTNRQRVGAWLNLSWAVPYSVDRIVLHDRINLDDNITSGTLTFSDGSSIPIGPLNNNGTATEYSFSARTITSLRMTVTGVSGSTYEIGLAEILVFGTASGQTQYSLTTEAAPLGAGSISVTPTQAGYYAGTQVTLTAIPNTGYAFSGWSGNATGTTNPLTITITANTSVTANFTAITGTLAITPSTGLTASGAPGGPFTPSAATYTLQNPGNAPINWTASATQSWVTLSSNSGNLAPGNSATVIVSINSAAASLGIGTYAGTVTFTNLTNGNGNSSRSVSLTIAQLTVNIAPLATVTASSQNTQDGQTAAKAVDGVVDGYPNDGTREWSSTRQHAGAWLNLSWAAPHTVNRVVLHDRINLDDAITSGTLTFSDGSSIPIGPLNNNGTATEYSFPARTVTSVRMTVTGVSGSTYEIGLAEILVFGN